MENVFGLQQSKLPLSATHYLGESALLVILLPKMKLIINYWILLTCGILFFDQKKKRPHWK